MAAVFAKNIWHGQHVLGDNDVFVSGGSSAPTNGTSGTGATVAGPGSLYIRTNGSIYQNTNTKASPTWTLIGTQVGSSLIGYGTGSGGTVTQATNKSTGVTLSKSNGAITMNNAALADATTVSFTVTNTLVGANDNVVVTHASAGTAGAYLVSANAIAAGSFKISVRNVSGGSLSEAIVLKFSVIAGAAA